MQFPTLLLSLLFASLTLCSDSPAKIQKRDAAKVLTDISSIGTIVDSLTTAATSYTGSLTQTLALASTVSDLKAALSTATTDVEASAAFSGEESGGVGTAVGELTPKIVGVLDVLSSKASVISSAGYTSIVQGELKTLMTNTDALLVALEGKSVVADVDKLKGLQRTVGDAFGKAVAAFQEKSKQRDAEMQLGNLGFSLHL